MSSMNSTLVPINGNTYPIRDQLKALGAKWNGDRRCWMVSSDKAAQAQALVTGQPVLNNPVVVPSDQGPLDIAKECAKHGRVPAGTEIVPFRPNSSKNAVGEVGKVFWGKHRGERCRFLVLRESRPYYLSATTLEDNDDFTSRPGWYRDLEAVAVEWSDAEIADEKKKAETLAAEEEVRRIRNEKIAAEKEAERAAKAARIEANQPRLREIAAQVAASEELGGEGGCQLVWGSWEGVHLSGSHGFLIYRSPETDRNGPVYADGSGGRPLGRVIRDAALADEAFRLAEVKIAYMH